MKSVYTYAEKNEKIHAPEDVYMKGGVLTWLN